MKPTLPDGMTVKIFHYRRFDLLDGVAYLTRGEAKNLGIEAPPLSKGGITHAVVFNGDEIVPNVLGVAECSNRENYSKSKGRSIAVGRAIKQMQEV